MTRQVLRVNLVEGTPYDDYTGRMEDLNEHIRNTQKKIENLERSLQTSAANEGAFAKTIKQLKADLAARGKELVFLKHNLARFRCQKGP